MTMADYEWFTEQHRKQMEGKKCARCGCDADMMLSVREDMDSPTYPVCRICLDNSTCITDKVRKYFITGESDFFIGCKAEGIPKLREAFSNVGLDGLVQYLDELVDDHVGWERKKKEAKEQ